MNNNLEQNAQNPRAQRAVEWAIGIVMVIIIIKAGATLMNRQPEAAVMERSADSKVVAECEELAGIAGDGAFPVPNTAPSPAMPSAAIP